MHKYQHEFNRWFSDGGDRTHRVNYHLTGESVVLDAGGYHGDFAAEIYRRYGCQIHIFEPEPNFADIIEKRFYGNPKITLHRYGLSNKNGIAILDVKEDGTSVIDIVDGYVSANDNTATLRDINEVVDELELLDIDLFKINIEGGEFPLMERCIEKGIVRRVNNFQIQYHDFVPNAEEKRNKINKNLENTHLCQYNYAFVWEGWGLKNDIP
jgi:FkbM family methyltransferase